MSIFLDQSDVAILTGKKKKSCQVWELRKMGIPFIVNSSGRPVVSIEAIEGRKSTQAQPSSWTPSVLGHGKKTA